MIHSMLNTILMKNLLLGLLRQRQLGQLFLTHRPFNHCWMQNVEIIEKFHHNSTSTAKELCLRSSVDVFAAFVERHT